MASRKGVFSKLRDKLKLHSRDSDRGSASSSQPATTLVIRPGDMQRPPASHDIPASTAVESMIAAAEPATTSPPIATESTSPPAPAVGSTCTQSPEPAATQPISIQRSRRQRPQLQRNSPHRNQRQRNRHLRSLRRSQLSLVPRPAILPPRKLQPMPPPNPPRLGSGKKRYRACHKTTRTA